MTKSEQDVLDELRRDAEDAQKLFSNRGQDTQERTVVAGLLRVLGVKFREEEIIKRGPEPIDVWFREARFQVTEILDEGRTRNRELKQRTERIKSATSLQDLVQPGIISSNPITPEELFTLVLDRCQEKAQRYGRASNTIDLLIYVNLHGRHLYPQGPLPDVSALASVGWRSVSVIMEKFAAILFTSRDAPEFLCERSGQVICWPGLESVFPKLSANPSADVRE